MGYKWVHSCTYIDNTGKKRTVRLYNTWKNMIARCSNVKTKCYPYYGGRGIIVCEEWLDYDNFYEWAMSNGYDDTLTIDRINVNGNYNPNNCRWVDKEVQANNTRANVYIGNMTLAQYSRKIGVNYDCVKGRLYRGDDNIGRPIERTARMCEGYTLLELSDKFNINLATIKARWDRGYRTLEDLTAEVIPHNTILVEGKSLQEISKLYNIPYNVLKQRYYKGKTTILNITTSVTSHNPKIEIEGKSLREISKSSGIKVATLRQRYNNGDNSIKELTRPVRGAK